MSLPIFDSESFVQFRKAFSSLLGTWDDVSTDKIIFSDIYFPLKQNLHEKIFLSH